MGRKRNMNIAAKLSGKVCILIDAANLESALKDLGWHIDYRKLRSFFENGATFSIRFYSVLHHTENQTRFFSFLRHAGFTLITKPLKIIHDRTNAVGHIRKANFDVEISVDAILHLHAYDNLILFSGDSDFDYLLRKVRRQRKFVTVISSRNHVSRELIASSDRYVDLKNLRPFIERTNKSPSLGSNPSTGG